MSYRHISHDTIGQVLSRLAAGVIMLDAYAEVNEGEECAGDLKYGSDSLRSCMYLLAGEELSERILAALREKVKADSIGEEDGHIAT